MQWTDEGVVLSVRHHGEASVIVDVLTKAHGRHAGLVRGGRSRRMSPVLQPGNNVVANWSARLDGQLGVYRIEGTNLTAAAMLGSAAFLHGIGWISFLGRLLPEREPQAELYEAAILIIERLHDPYLAAPLLIRFELRLLAELGFGLDLSACAGTGATQDLVYVSPKSGRAVSRSAGAPYAERLLALPAFLREADSAGLDAAALTAGFALTAHFLMRDVTVPRGLDLPDSRRAYRDLALTSAPFTEAQSLPA